MDVKEVEKPKGKWDNPLNLNQYLKIPFNFDIPMVVQKVSIDKRFTRITYPTKLSKKIVENRHRSLVGKFVSIRLNLDSLKKWAI